MPRANRHYLPGYVWHITHRCHKQEFLLKFARDRRRWLHWLFEAKTRYRLSVLNYMVTSNHIHLLVRDTGQKEAIPKSIQLIASRTGQEFNQRKDRMGLKDLLGFNEMSALAAAYKGWVEESIGQKRSVRDGKWTEAVVVGREAFVTSTRQKLGFRAKGRKVIGTVDHCELMETQVPYNANLGRENAFLRVENEHFGKILIE